MNEPPLLDTHIWLWWMLGDPRLGPAEVEFFDRLPPHRRPCLCTISMWETALLVELGRLELSVPLEAFLKVAASPATVRLCPIEVGTVVEMNTLPDSFHHDPADRLIVATARAGNLPLASRDGRIVDSGLTAVWSL
jgi:PIN domain nuclease of toxin-antitoxin system